MTDSISTEAAEAIGLIEVLDFSDPIAANCPLLLGIACPAADAPPQGCNQIQQWEQAIVKIETETPVLPYPHLYEMLALQEGVRMFRAATPAELAGFSDVEVLRMIRATCRGGDPCASLADRIDADHNAILCALNAVGEPLRAAHSGNAQ